jgi:ubiquinone/menaquinone biosynthesis C-methylase UbiE
LVADLVDRQENQPLKVLDVAAGHGLFGLAIAQRNPQATVTLIDWQNVLQVARENAAKADVIDRVEFRAGDAFAVEFGEDQDVVILANFLHHFDEAACEKILRKAYAALKDGGRVVTVEFIANEDRTSPTIAAEFSMMMLGTTLRGEAWAYSDLERMFRRTGCWDLELRAIPPAMERVVLATKTMTQRAER